MLKAVLCGFSGVIINDEATHQRLIDEALLAENLRPDPEGYRNTCFGRSDRTCFETLMSQRGRVLKATDYTRLLTQKATGYNTWFNALEKAPLYPGLEDFIFRVRTRGYPMVLVTTAQQAEVAPVLQRAQLNDVFTLQVTGNLPIPSKPNPAPYATAIAQLNQQQPNLALTPEQCVAVEDSFAGIAAAKAAGVPVIGVAHTYPHYMLQRQATWVVDYLNEIEFDWIRQRYGEVPPPETALADAANPSQG
ncbi:MAG: HAD family phosphatase [Cyanobacteria bacterium P01_A01_bin.105]